MIARAIVSQPGTKEYGDGAHLEINALSVEVLLGRSGIGHRLELPIFPPYGPAGLNFRGANLPPGILVQLAACFGKLA